MLNRRIAQEMKSLHLFDFPFRAADLAAGCPKVVTETASSPPRDDRPLHPCFFHLNLVLDRAWHDVKHTEPSPDASEDSIDTACDTLALNSLVQDEWVS